MSHEPTRESPYVPNHRQLSEGDLLVLRDRTSILGIARASRIISFKKPKELSRCPTCRIATIKARKNMRPRYRCKAGHEFDEPVVTQEPCVHYEAWFDGTFQASQKGIPARSVRQACPNYNGQLAMQRVELERLEGEAKTLLHLAASLNTHKGIRLTAADASEDPYVPNDQDHRQLVARQIRARRGQGALRQALRERFNDTCLVTGCRLPDLLEAAHISPHRGDKDNHVSTGLLLRADIHTLFDLDLLGINPTTLQLCLHPRAKDTEYAHLAGTTLACAPHLLSREALESRWKAFQASLPG
ncbi:MAG TPA: HNH endonuclease signature motif containing protein [Myxococcaceae bacterium]|nr:HNH endonuclease signature motif containing protein [Myxococcaceae bacterium]